MRYIQVYDYLPVNAMKNAIIYMPSTTATQSGKGKKRWVIKLLPSQEKYNEPLMGWVGSGDTDLQVEMEFDTLEMAERHATRMGIIYQVLYPKKARIHPKSYASNFK